MVKQGQRVKVEGKESIVETIWGQGRHTVFKLTDGREILDLHLLVECDKAEIMPDLTFNTNKTIFTKVDFSLPKDDDDFEE